MSDFSKNVLILGGGPAGLAAAKALTQRGIGVRIVEKGDRLGGKAFGWSCMATDVCKNCGACLVAGMADDVKRLDTVKIMTGTWLTEAAPKGQRIQAVLEGKNGGVLPADAILMATGFQPFDPSQLTSLGHGVGHNVVTTAELNDMIKTGELAARFPEGSNPKIAFIQCVGSRNKELGRNYCSQVCCKISLRMANKLLHLYPDADLTVFHMDLQIIGKAFRAFTEELSRKIKLAQGVPAEISFDRKEGKATIIREDETVGVRKAHHFDMVVLSIGMGREKADVELSKALGIETDQWGFAGTEEGKYPRGIYAAGAARGPMSIVDSIREGAVAAARIAADLDVVADDSKRLRVAVIGDGQEARKVSRSLSRAGHAVLAIGGQNHPAPEASDIQHYPNGRLISVQGVVKNFRLKVESGDETLFAVADAFVVAAGCSKDSRLSSSDPRIQSLSVFEKKTAEDANSLPDSITFWLDYLVDEWKDNSRRVVKLASKLAQDGKKVQVIMEKMLVHGLEGQEIYDRARNRKVTFIRAVDPQTTIIHTGGGKLELTLPEQTLPGMEMRLETDLLVVPDRVQPPDQAPWLAELLGEPLDAEGFLQSPNTRHRPVGSPRRGIFYAGSCHDETDDGDLEEEIAAVLTGLDFIAKNDLISPTPAKINENQCVKCLTCFRICPHGAVTLQSSNKPLIHPEACFECGLCVSSCPAKAISRQGLSDRELTEDAGDCDTFVFACERSAALAAEQAMEMGFSPEQKVTVKRVRCAGSVGVETVLLPLMKGAKRVVVAGCHEGNCRSMESGTYAPRRIDHTVSELGIASKSIDYFSVAANEPDSFRKLISNTSENK